MTTNRSDGMETRRSLLDAAAVIFAAKGFHDTRIVDICRVSGGANMAAVNYHFGSKEKLYVEAWRHAFERSMEAYPPDGAVSPNAPVEDRLRGQILALFHRIMDPTNLDFDIAHKEMANPTGLLSEIMRRSIDPLRAMLVKVVREFLGTHATEEQVRLCEMSIHAQCFFQLLHRRQGKCTSAGSSPPVPFASEAGIDALADHIVRFNLAGLRECRRQCAKQAKCQANL